MNGGARRRLWNDRKERHLPCGCREKTKRIGRSIRGRGETHGG
jgi:hypothetical protein